MAQYQTGSVSVTNGSSVVYGTDTTWLDDGVTAGHYFSVSNDDTVYEITYVPDNGTLHLAAVYAGTTDAAADYTITVDFTTYRSYPVIYKGDIETAGFIRRALTLIDTDIHNILTGAVVIEGIDGDSITFQSITGTLAASSVSDAIREVEDIIYTHETSSDPHTQYLFLAGRTGGQTAYGGDGSGDDLTFYSTSHATKGTIFFGGASGLVFDEVNTRLGLGGTPSYPLDITGNINTSAAYLIAGVSILSNTTLGSSVVNSSLTSVGTLVSLTITGDLTVDTSTLKVDSTNNRVGVVNAAPSYPLDVTGNINSTTGFLVAGTSVLTSTTLGSGVVNSSLTSLGTLTALTVNASPNITTGNTYNINSVAILSATALGSSVVGSSLTSVGVLTGLAVGGTADASALLTLTSTTRGLLLPRMTTTERDAISTPTSGLLIYNSTTAAMNIYAGGWSSFAASQWTTTGSDIYFANKIRVGSAVAPTYHVDVAGSVNISTGQVYRINGTSILSETALGSSVVSSSLTSVGTLTSLAVAGNIVSNSGGLFVGSNRTDVYSLTMIGYGSLTGASYASKTVSVTSTVTSGVDLAMSSDGTAVYVISSEGGSADKVVQWTLSTAWDISTATSASKSVTVGSQETSPQGVAFGDSGTKMYVVGTSSRTIFQYTLSTAWDVSTASYASKSLLISASATNPVGLRFSSDGTKCYVVTAETSTADKINQYTLSTAWDISTASTTPSASLTTGTQDTTPTGLAIDPEGKKIYVMGSASNTLYQYSMTTAWDLSTASYDSVSLAVSGQTTSGAGVAVRGDFGTSLYVFGQTGNNIYQYTLPIASVTKGAGSAALSIALTSTGVFTITHNFGTTNYTVAAMSSDGTTKGYGILASRGANSCVVNLYNSSDALATYLADIWLHRHT